MPLNWILLKIPLIFSLSYIKTIKQAVSHSKKHLDFPDVAHDAIAANMIHKVVIRPEPALRYGLF